MSFQQELDFSINLALETGDMLIDHFKQQGIAGKFKKDFTLVTEVDSLANEHIITRIKEQYPDDAILSEEGITSITKVPKRLWIIDPIDGTTNYCLGFPVWGVSIALFIDGLPQIGVVNFPILNELYTATHNTGAYLNNSILENTDTRPIPILSHCSRTTSTYNLTTSQKCRIWGSATYNICSVASGKSAASIDVSTKIWDIAAGYLIIKESNCEIQFLTQDRSNPFPLQPRLDYENILFPTITAINSEQLNNVLQNLKYKSGV